MQAMRVMFVWLLLNVTPVVAHPSAGLVVTEKGEVYFVHSGVGVARIEANGTLTYVKRSKGGHWLCLDREGAFARTQPKFFERITVEGQKPAIIFADGGAPIAVGRDGQLYFASNWEEGGDQHPPGGLTVSRQTVDGKLSVESKELGRRLRKSNADFGLWIRATSCLVEKSDQLESVAGGARRSARAVRHWQGPGGARGATRLPCSAVRLSGGTASCRRERPGWPFPLEPTHGAM